MNFSHFKKWFCGHNKGGLIAVLIVIFVCMISQQSKAEEFSAMEVTPKAMDQQVFLS